MASKQNLKNVVSLYPDRGARPKHIYDKLDAAREKRAKSLANRDAANSPTPVAPAVAQAVRGITKDTTAPLTEPVQPVDATEAEAAPFARADLATSKESRLPRGLITVTLLAAVGLGGLLLMPRADGEPVVVPPQPSAEVAPTLTLADAAPSGAFENNARAATGLTIAEDAAAPAPLSPGVSLLDAVPGIASIETEETPRAPVEARVDRAIASLEVAGLPAIVAGNLPAADALPTRVSARTEALGIGLSSPAAELVDVTAPGAFTAPEVGSAIAGLPGVVRESLPEVTTTPVAPPVETPEVADAVASIPPEAIDEPVPTLLSEEASLAALFQGKEVFLHAPDAVPGDEVAAMESQIDALGVPLVEVRLTGFTISSPNVRYFHAEDEAAAATVANAVGAELRDFTDFTPSPRDGLIEVWMDGAPQAPAPVVQVATPRRAAPVATLPERVFRRIIITRPVATHQRSGGTVSRAQDGSDGSSVPTARSVTSGGSTSSGGGSTRSDGGDGGSAGSSGGSQDKSGGRSKERGSKGRK